MPQARVRDTDVSEIKIRSTDTPLVRTSGRVVSTTSEVSIPRGTPIGLLLALTYAINQTVIFPIDALGPKIRIRTTT